MFERFTDRARQVLVLAQEGARDLNHNFIGTEHILYGLTAEGGEREGGVAAKVLHAMNVTPDSVKQKIQETIGVAGTGPSGSPPFTPRAKKVMELSLREALQLGHSYIGTEHILLGLVREGDGVGVTILGLLGAAPGEVRKQVMEVIDGEPKDMAASEHPFVMPEDWISTTNGEVYIPVGDDGVYVKATFAIRVDGTPYKFKQKDVPTWVVAA